MFIFLALLNYYYFIILSVNIIPNLILFQIYKMLEVCLLYINILNEFR